MFIWLHVHSRSRTQSLTWGYPFWNIFSGCRVKEFEPKARSTPSHTVHRIRGWIPQYIPSRTGKCVAARDRSLWSRGFWPQTREVLPQNKYFCKSLKSPEWWSAFAALYTCSSIEVRPLQAPGVLTCLLNEIRGNCWRVKRIKIARHCQRRSSSTQLTASWTFWSASCWLVGVRHQDMRICFSFAPGAFFPKLRKPYSGVVQIWFGFCCSGPLSELSCHMHSWPQVPCIVFLLWESSRQT